ncbi:hypothetical protein ACHAW5_003894 [Stephanodiscus triporus]|uniref:Uncharacterized protein n=1 Tax=Stephanodiscus triporus TaxID=2934178 RepID=A0ABD3MSU2_9STRA
MDVVDGILDDLFAKTGNDNDLVRITGGSITGRGRADWRHVLKCLRTSAAMMEEKMGMKDDAGFSTVDIRETQGKIRLNSSSLTSLSMRLVERYGTETHRMPL